MDDLVRIYKKLLRETDTRFLRYLYDEIDWKNRIVGIRGARGVGKTTLMLQHIKKELNPEESLYVNADDLYFSNHRLIDLAERLVQRGIRYFFIDEIHKYKDWSRELKLIYDYYSELNVVFSGSSILDLNKGTSDLSRRAVVYQLYGLSFREYLALFHDVRLPSFSLDEILAGEPERLKLKTPLLFFEDYLKRGYYPFALMDGYSEKLRQIVNLTLETDIPVFANLPASMGRKFKHLLMIIAQSVPFKPVIQKLAEATGINRNDIPNYLIYMEKAGMIAQLRNATGGIRGLGKVEKLYLDNTNLIYTLVSDRAETGNVRETFFMNQTRVMNEVTSSALSDFEINGKTFEIGGRKKGQKQIESAQEGYIVKDDIESGYANIIPLWAFGLNY